MGDGVVPFAVPLVWGEGDGGVLAVSDLDAGRVPVRVVDALDREAGLGFRVGDFPVTEKAASQILSLPMFPNLTDHQQERIAAQVLKSLMITSERG